MLVMDYSLKPHCHNILELDKSFGPHFYNWLKSTPKFQCKEFIEALIFPKNELRKWCRWGFLRSSTWQSFNEILATPASRNQTHKGSQCESCHSRTLGDEWRYTTFKLHDPQARHHLTLTSKVIIHHQQTHWLGAQRAQISNCSTMVMVKCITIISGNDIS